MKGTNIKKEEVKEILPKAEALKEDIKNNPNW